MDWVRMRDPAGRVLALPSQTPGLIEQIGLTRTQVNRSVWVITRDGRCYHSAAASNRVLQELQHSHWRVLARLYRVPGLGRWEEWCYAWFARNRGHFVRWGMTPACERPGVPCTPEGQ
ncbi:MAG: thiol-disulfide oxidoreductase DCC family protein [Dehalococcoidia bacterium]